MIQHHGTVFLNLFPTTNFLASPIYSLPVRAVCLWLLLPIRFQTRPDKMSGLIWSQTIWHSDGIPERIFWKSWLWKKSADVKNVWKNYPACKDLTVHVYTMSTETLAFTWSLTILTRSLIAATCRPLITFANSLEADQNQQNVSPDLYPNHLELR